MRNAAVAAFLFLASLCASAQSNPVPFVNQPVVPMTAAPGGPGFTLTVNGAGFVSGSVVNWNGAALTTTFVSSTQLTATVPAAKIASAGTASVTVANPAPGGGASNVQFFAVSNLIPTVSFVGTYGVTVQVPTGIVADFNGDGKQDLAYVQTVSGPVEQIVVELGNGDGSFQSPQVYSTGFEFGLWVVGDFNGDGKLDLAIIQGGDGPNLGVLLGNGDGTFQSPIWTNFPGANSGSMTTGDFNGDGKLDLAVGGEGSVTILLGNGDGTFTQAGGATFSSSNFLAGALVAGDFNRDGKLDVIAVTYPINGIASGGLYFVPGEGNGQLAAPSTISSATGNQQSCLWAADFNGDGNLDLAFTSNDGLSIFLGNGDGTFQTPASYPQESTELSAADFNADGKLDLMVNNYLYLGNGDGTFQTPVSTFNPGPSGRVLFSAIADFNGDGKMDFAGVLASELVSYLQNQGAIDVFSPSAMSFAQQAIGITSAAQVASLENVGESTASISSIAITGANAGDFGQTNNCGATLASNALCDFNITFTPSAPGTRTATLSVSDNSSGSPHLVMLSGTGPVPNITFTPSSLTFPAQYVGTSGLPQSVSLANVGTSTITITSATVSPSDFGVVNSCGSSLAAGNSCSISVFFDPTTSGTRTGNLTITDSGIGSPQTVALSGTGQDFSMAASGSSSASVAPGQTATYIIALSPGGNFNGTVNLGCSGAPALSTCSLSATSLVLSGSTATSVTVSVATTGSAARLSHPSRLGGANRESRFALFLFAPGLFAPGIAGLILLCPGRGRGRLRRRFGTTALMLSLLCLGVGWIGVSWMACGGSHSASGGGVGGTQAGTYSIVVTATFTSGSTTLTHNTTLSLTVQ